VLTLDELNDELWKLSSELSEAQKQLEQWTQRYSIAEDKAGRERSRIILQHCGEKETVQLKEARVIVEIAELLFEQSLAKGMKEAQLEAIRNIRAQLSALQTIANNERASIDLERVTA